VILCDTGIIVAAIRDDDKFHDAAITTLGRINEPLITTWPCLTEAMHLLGAQVGKHAQEMLRAYIEARIYVLHRPTPLEEDRICALMRQYADAPMDLADGSLVVAAEVLVVRKILTIDHHFYAYRINGITSFEILP